MEFYNNYLGGYLLGKVWTLQEAMFHNIFHFHLRKVHFSRTSGLRRIIPVLQYILGLRNFQMYMIESTADDPTSPELPQTNI